MELPRRDAFVNARRPHAAVNRERLSGVYSGAEFGGTIAPSGSEAQECMKVIFLDIDGVLNCAKTPNPRELPYVIDARLKKELDGLLERTGAKIVLTSTWRYDPAALFTLKRHGIRFVDVVPDMPQRPRRDEILAWLKKADRVTRYAVIDDEDDGLDGLPLFLPSPRTGLSRKIVNGVVKYLDGKTDRDMRRPLITRVVQNLRAMVTGHKG